MLQDRESLAGDVVLREVAEGDLPIFYEHQCDPEATRMAGFPARDWEAFSAHWQRIRARPTVVALTIVVDGQTAGNVVSWEDEGRRFVGYWIGRELWGRGVATAALAAFLQQAPNRPLYAGVARHNIGSIRVLEKCGFALSQTDVTLVSTEHDEAEELTYVCGTGE